MTDTKRVLVIDPWEHRAQTMRCDSCMWFVEKKGIQRSTADSDLNALKKLGRCRRHAPTMNGYPAVFIMDWCGDHKIDELKI